MPYSPEKHIWLPVPVGIWGLLEESHSHIEIHRNWVLHAGGGSPDKADGFVLGVAAYPLRDFFQEVSAKSTRGLNFHGPVRWLKGHTFDSFAPSKSEAARQVAAAQQGSKTVVQSARIGVVAPLAAVLGALLALLMAWIYYSQVLRPAVVKEFLKVD